jgi:aminoglycoside phosphotransferase (APT) family kinase protein
MRTDEEFRALLIETTETMGWGEKRKLGLQVPPSFQPVFTYADLHMKSIMVDGAKITGILDWETAG